MTETLNSGRQQILYLFLTATYRRRLNESTYQCWWSHSERRCHASQTLHKLHALSVHGNIGGLMLNGGRALILALMICCPWDILSSTLIAPQYGDHHCSASWRPMHHYVEFSHLGLYHVAWYLQLLRIVYLSDISYQIYKAWARGAPQVWLSVVLYQEYLKTGENRFMTGNFAISSTAGCQISRLGTRGSPKYRQ